MNRINNLAVLLPTRNRPKDLYNCLKSFDNLHLKKSCMIIIDDNSDNNEEINGKLMSNIDVVKLFDPNKFKYIYLNKKSGWKDYFKNYLQLSNSYKYFCFMSDDDFFNNNNLIYESINILEGNKSISYVVTPATMFDIDDNWQRYFKIPNQTFTGTEFLEEFISSENLQHATCTGIFRIKNLLKLDCFETLNLSKHKLQDGFGIDTRWFFRNASLGNIMCIGNQPSRSIKFHKKGMTWEAPLESSYCYYLNVTNSINFLKERGINSKKFDEYILFWIKNIATAILILKFNEKKEDNYRIVKSKMNNDFTFFINKELKKHRIDKDEKIKFYIKLIKILKMIPNFLIKKNKNEGFVPNSYAQIILFIYPFHYIKKIKSIYLFSKIINYGKKIYFLYYF